MHDWLAVTAMSVGIFGLRFSGFVVPVHALPERWKRGLRTLPIALLAALIASSKSGLASGDPARVLAIAVAAAVAWRFRQVWLVIATGLAVYWVTRSFGWGE